MRPAPPSTRPGGPRPEDNPDFYRLPAPPGRSRESTIVLDREGHFVHDGERVEHPNLEAAMHTWIRRHPDDGRYILSNGYDWSYFQVEDVPFFVRRIITEDGGEPLMLLSDGSVERLEPREVTVGEGEELFVQLKNRPRPTDAPVSTRSGTPEPTRARFLRQARLDLAPWLSDEPGETADTPRIYLTVGSEKVLLSR